MAVTAPIKVVFFDIGNTLVKSIHPTSNGVRFEWLEGTKEGLIQLKERGVQLGLLSNTGDLNRTQLFALLPEDFNEDIFEPDLIILSSEFGIEKPALSIFAHALDKSTVVPGDCLFCTEELSHVLAAQQIGLRSVWLPFSSDDSNIRTLVTELLNSQPD